jgi:predicted transcriptional regulator
MLLKTVAETLELHLLAGPAKLDSPVSGVYVGDLLSLVMADARAGNVWVTHQGHQNIVAVASLLNLSGIIIAGGSNIRKEAVAHAATENIPLFASSLSVFELAGRLFAMGLRT